MRILTADQIDLSFPAPPRRVLRKPWSGGCALWFVRLFILPHCTAAVFLLLSVPAHLYVENFGAPTTATIDQRTATPTRKGGCVYEIFYHYALASDRYDERTSVGQDTYNGLHVGDQLEGHAAAIGNHALFIGPDWQNQGVIFPAIFALFMFGILSVFVYGVWVLPLRHRRIARIGLPTIGTITGRRERKGKGTTYTVLYAFQTPDGQSFSGKYDVNDLDYQRAAEGSLVTVLYDPRKPRRNLPYEYCEFTVEDR